MRKCCKVQLTKNGKSVTAFIPGNLAQKFIDEHEWIMIERIGGKQGLLRRYSSVRYAVIKVNDQPLDRLWLGKIQKVEDKMTEQILKFWQIWYIWNCCQDADLICYLI